MISNNGETYFTREELECKGTGILILAPGFADKLLELRLAFNKPMSVSSCCRAYFHNVKVGGYPRSLHVCDDPYWPTDGCCAIDIRTIDGVYRAQLIKVALDLGWSVGVHSNFIHLDRRSDYIPLKQSLFPY